MSSDDLVKLAALYRHWIIADSVRAVLRQKASTPEQEARTNKEFGIEYVAFGEHASMICRMQVWYSLLYVVVEGYRELGQKYEPLEEVLAKGEFADLLRRYRNATFHFQADPLSEKLISFLEKEDSEVWIRDLNEQLEAFLRNALPIKEVTEKLRENGPPEIPDGTKLSILLRPSNGQN